MQQLGRLLLAGYALAAAGATGMYQAGSSLPLAVAVFWLGGALAVAILAVIVTPFLATKPVSTAANDAALAEALRLWEEDRLGDTPSASRPGQSDQAAG